MSDTRDARPGAPRPPAAAPKAAAVPQPQPQSPRIGVGGVRPAAVPQQQHQPPAHVQQAQPAQAQQAPPPPPPPLPAAQAPPSKSTSEPPESGWDGWENAEQLPSSAVIEAAEEAFAEARALPPVAQRTSERGLAARPASSPDLIEPPPPKIRAPSSPDIPPMARRARSSPDLPPLTRTQQMPTMTGLAPVALPAPAPAAALAAKPATPPAPPVEPVVAAPAAAALAVPAPVPTPTPTPNPIAIIESLPHDVQEQLFGILRASLDATLLPVREKQRELEVKLAWLHQENERAKAEARSQPNQPVAAPVAAAAAAAPGSVAPPAIPVSVAPPPAAPAAPSISPKAAVIETSFGLVMAPPNSLRRPSIELALENVGPVDVTEFSRGRVSAGAVLVALLLAGVAAAIAAMALSYT